MKQHERACLGVQLHPQCMSWWLGAANQARRSPGLQAQGVKLLVVPDEAGASVRLCMRWLGLHLAAGAG